MTATQDIAEDTPVLFAWSAVEQRETDHRTALDAAGLMIKATRHALPGVSGEAILRQVDWIGVPEGTTRYPDPGRLVGTAIGAGRARTIVAKVGVLQQSLITAALVAVQSGSSKVALVCGGEAKFRDQCARRADDVAPISHQAPDVHPDETWAPEAELVLPCEAAAGLRTAAGFYAIMESAWRALHGHDVASSRRQLGELYAPFTETAARNPHANRRAVHSAAEIWEDSDQNPMIAFPYTRRMASAWTVDQAAALLIGTAGTARSLGIPQERWLYPSIAVESNAVSPLVARADMTRSFLMRLMSEVASEATGMTLSDVDHFDLYSCFPIAVKLAAEALGLASDRNLTVTGGMPFAGGPYNNYVLQATCRAADILVNAGRPETALVSCVSGLYSKHGFTIWSAAPPRRAFQALDCTHAVRAVERLLPVARYPAGFATISGYTVLYRDSRPERAIVVADLPDDTRAIAASLDPSLIERLLGREPVGRRIVLRDGSFGLT